MAANEITLSCPNCHELVVLVVKVNYLHCVPKTLRAQVEAAGAHTCTELAPKPRAKKATADAGES